MAERRLIINRPNSSSPPPNCAICLGTCTNNSFSDSCMHQFCFKCLLEWSKIKAECPLCKQPFRRILHNIKSNEEYDEHVVEIAPSEEIHIIDNEEFLVLPLTPSTHTRHQFHFRTTFTVDTRGEHAIQQMLLTHPLTNGGISIEGYAPGRNMYHRRRRDNTTTSFRRSIYSRNLWVNAPPDVTGRYRDVTPSFYRSCPGARTRLVPWLNRELNALLFENTQLVMRLVDIIMDHLLRHHICSRTFRNLLFEYLDNKTDHFVHEFYNFMRSPFDMIGYDRHVIYTERPQSPAPYIDVSDNDHDSDVIIVGATSPDDPVVIDLVDTDSDEPILVSHEEPQLPMPIPERCSEPENRAPVLPLKLRLKHKRQTREKEKEKKLRQKKRIRRHRSRSTSSTTSNSSDDSSKNSYKRYKRRKKHKKSSKKRVSLFTSSDSDINVDKTNSESPEDDLPLSALTGRKKHSKKIKHHDRHYKLSKRSGYSSVSSSTKDHPRKEADRVPKVCRPQAQQQDNSNVPSCSRYSSDCSSPSYSPYSSGRFDKPADRAAENCDDSSGSVNVPTCSKYAYSPYTSSQDGTASSNVNAIRSDKESSNEENYPLQNLVKSEVREVRPEERNSGPSGSNCSGSNGGPSGSNSSGSNGDPSGSNSSGGNVRLRNIVIKKEGSTNLWFSYSCNYSDSDSSDN